jgi:hypothetical protein
MWREGSTHLDGVGQKVMIFAQCNKLKFFGQKIRAKNTDGPDAGTADNSPFQEFFRL